MSEETMGKVKKINMNNIVDEVGTIYRVDLIKFELFNRNDEEFIGWDKKLIVKRNGIMFP
jgi:hypothetical protein